jgi:hypothetical protein
MSRLVRRISCSLAALVVSLVAASTSQAVPDPEDCYGDDPSECQCYVVGRGFAFEYDEEYLGPWPTSPVFLGYRYNNISHNDCQALYDGLPSAWGLWWISASACSAYNADQAAEYYWLYWEGSLEESIGYPLNYWQGGYFGPPFDCCGYYVHVCN